MGQERSKTLKGGLVDAVNSSIVNLWPSIRQKFDFALVMSYETGETANISGNSHLSVLSHMYGLPSKGFRKPPTTMPIYIMWFYMLLEQRPLFVAPPLVLRRRSLSWLSAQ